MLQRDMQKSRRGEVTVSLVPRYMQMAHRHTCSASPPPPPPISKKSYRYSLVNTGELFNGILKWEGGGVDV